VRKVGQLQMVDVVEGEGAAQVLRRRVVQLGRELDGEVQILSGLQPGEQVALPSEI
jgi:multidrug efflux pump subunit AcrA (membrane-fusion protein)